MQSLKVLIPQFTLKCFILPSQEMCPIHISHYKCCLHDAVYTNNNCTKSMDLFCFEKTQLYLLLLPTLISKSFHRGMNLKKYHQQAKLMTFTISKKFTTLKACGTTDDWLGGRTDNLKHWSLHSLAFVHVSQKALSAFVSAWQILLPLQDKYFPHKRI